MTILIDVAPVRRIYRAWLMRSYRSRIEVMTTRKLSITLPVELAEIVKHQAEEEGTSVSAVIADAVGVLARRRAAHEATEAFEAEEGPLTAAELAEAEERWRRIEAHGRERNRTVS